VTKVAQLINGGGPFAELGEQVYDDYWMYYLTRDMADALRVKRPYTNLKEYLEYKKRGIEKLTAHEKEILTMAEQEKPVKEEEPD